MTAATEPALLDHPQAQRPKQWLPLLVVGCALAVALWLWLWPRPPSLQLAPRDAAAVAALVGPLAVGPVTTAADASLVVGGPAGCAALISAGVRHEQDAVRAGRWSLAPDPNHLDTLTCVRWRSQLATTLTQDPEIDAVRPGGDVAARTAFDTALLTLAALLSGACLVLFGVVWWRQSQHIRRLGWATVLAVLAVHLWWPHRLTTVYFAYEYFAAAHYLDSVPRYGPGGPALWGLVLGPLAVDHLAALWLQTGLYAFGAAAWSMAMARGWGIDSGTWLAVVQVAGPLWLRESGSESLHIGAVAALGMAGLGLATAGLVGASGTAEKPTGATGHGSFGSAHWLAGLGLGWACLFRVDAALLLVVMAVLIGLAVGLRWRRLLLTFLPASPVVLAALIHAGLRATEDLDRNNLPQLAELPHTVLGHLVSDNLLVRGDWLPLGLWLPVLAWLAFGQLGRRGAVWLLAWLGVMLGWLVLSWLDFNETSLPRLQWPAAQMLALLAAGATALLGKQWPAIRRSLAGTGLLAVAISAVFTLPQIQRPTVPDAEDALWRRAAAALPQDAPYWLVTRTYAEGPAQGLHLHLPTWLLQPPGGQGRVVSLRDWQSLRDRGVTPDIPVYFLRTARCHAAPLHGPGAGLPATEHPACTAAVAAAKQPVFEATLVNVSDRPTFAWYGRAPVLAVGLYCLSGCKGAAAGP